MFLVIMGLVVLTLFVSARGYMKNRGAQADIAGEGFGQNPLISFPIAVLMFVAFVAAAIYSLQWTYSVRQFPLVAALPGIAFTFLLLFREGFALRRQVRQEGFNVVSGVAEKAQLKRALQFFGYLFAMFAGMLLAGHKVAMPLFVAAYLVRWGHATWRTALLYALGAWAVLVVFYDRVLNVFWYQAPLAEFLAGILPDWIPRWLFT